MGAYNGHRFLTFLLYGTWSYYSVTYAKGRKEEQGGDIAWVGIRLSGNLSINEQATMFKITSDTFNVCSNQHMS